MPSHSLLDNQEGHESLVAKTGTGCLVDFGAGTGRVLVFAGLFPFRRIVGVELVPELADKARENIQQALHHLTCRKIDVVTTDARLFPIPLDATVFYLHNPFLGEVLSRVVQKIRESVTHFVHRLVSRSVRSSGIAS